LIIPWLKSKGLDQMMVKNAKALAIVGATGAGDIMLQWLGFGVDCCHCGEICTGSAILVAKLHVTSHCDQPFYMEAQRAPTSALLGLALVLSCSSGWDLALIAATVAKYARDLQYWWQNCMRQVIVINLSTWKLKGHLPALCWGHRRW
jgi:hypothetical protein